MTTVLIFNMATLEATLANNHRELLVLMSPLEIALANILVMYSYYWMWRMSNKWCKLDFPYRFFVCLLYNLLAIVPLSPFHLDSTLLGMKDLLFVLLGFPRHPSLRDRSPESSEPYVPLDSRSSLIRTTSRAHTSFFPSSHLRVSRTPEFEGLLEELSHRYAVPREETTSACFHFQKKKVNSFLETFSSERIRAKLK